MKRSYSEAKMNQVSFENTLEDFSDSYRGSYLIDKKLSNEKIKKYENSVWEKTFKNYQREEDYSVYTGSTGIALLKLLIASRKSESEKKVLLEEARKLIPTHKLNRRRITFLCGDGGPLAIAAVIEHKLGNVNNANKLIQSLIELGDGVLDIESSIPNELLYGRAGYLFALLYVKQNIRDAEIDDDYIKQIIEVMLKAGQNESKALNLSKKVPLMYTWHDSNYLGAAHGLSGILYLLLQARKYVSVDALNHLIKPSIDFLISIRFSSGNFPSSLGKERDKLVQWCHGSPGFTDLFCLAYEVFNDKQYLNIALECGEVIWKRGILTKGYSICHGVAGNAYTFLKLFKTTKDEKHLHQAIQFAEWVTDYTTSHEFRYPDRPLSLFEGLAGRLYLIVDVQEPFNAKFPGYEL